MCHESIWWLLVIVSSCYIVVTKCFFHTVAIWKSCSEICIWARYNCYKNEVKHPLLKGKHISEQDWKFQNEAEFCLPEELSGKFNRVQITKQNPENNLISILEKGTLNMWAWSALWIALEANRSNKEKSVLKSGESAVDWSQTNLLSTEHPATLPPALKHHLKRPPVMQFKEQMSVLCLHIKILHRQNLLRGQLKEKKAV